MREITMELKGVQKTYVDSASNQVTAIKDITVAFEKEKMYAIYGPSGSGKTTLLNLLGLLDKPTFGKILINGVDVTYKNAREKACLRKDYLGFVFQDHFLNERLTVEQNLIMPMRINKKIPKTEYRKRCEEVLSLFGLEKFMGRYPRELSGGEQQRVCIARALVNEPTVILADEPTGNLDAKNGDIVAEQLKSLTEQGKTIIVVTHNEMMRKYADAVYILKNGNLTEEPVPGPDNRKV